MKKNNKELKCQCFFCRHRNRPDLLQAYYQGCIDSLKPFLTWMEESNIGKDSVHKGTLESQHTILEDCLNYYQLSVDEIGNQIKATKIFANKRLIDEHRQFLALFKSFSEYQVFYVRTNPETQRKEVVSCGDNNIYPISIINNFKHIIYLDTIFSALYSTKGK